MGNYMDDDMSLTPQQEAMMADMFDDAERAADNAGYILSGENDLVDPEVLVELYLDSPLERSTLAVMLAKQLGKELADAHGSLFEQQSFIHNRTGKPIVVHMTDENTAQLKISPAFEEDLDLFSGRFIDFLSAVPLHIAMESVDHYFLKLADPEYTEAARKFYQINPDINVDSLNYIEVPKQSLLRAIESLPPSEFKTKASEVVSTRVALPERARTTLTGFAL